MRIAGGMPSDDFPVTLQEINLWIDQGIAASAMKNYGDGVQIDGFEFIGDAYYCTFRNLNLVQDTTSLYYHTTLPTAPVGVPRGYDITDAYIQQPQGGYGKPMVRVTPQQLGFYDDLPKPKNSIEYWVENTTLFVKTDLPLLLTGSKVAVRMIGSAGDRSLTAEVLAPQDAIPYIVEYIMKIFVPTDSAPKDTMNDGTNIK